jgi:hypothetical protein
MSTKATLHQPPVQMTRPVPKKAAEIVEVSPEGVPDHPEMGPRQIGLLLAAIVVGIFVIALVTAAFLSPIAGAALGALALLLFVGNPAVWAALLRAKEISDVDTDQASSPRNERGASIRQKGETSSR